MSTAQRRRSTPGGGGGGGSGPRSQPGRRQQQDGSGGSGGSGSGVCIREGVGFAQVELGPESQGCLVWGSGSLEVTAGSLDVAGYVAEAGSPPVPFSIDPRAGGALLLLPARSPVRAPRVAAPAGATVMLHCTASGDAGGGGCADGGGGGGSSSYGVCAAGEPGAPAFNALSAEWRAAAGELAETSQQRRREGAGPMVAAVCGPKGAGKSTFARLLVNALLSAGHAEVVYLDTDCGQPELTPPGLVSAHVLTAPLLGAAHLHHREPALAFFQGDVSPESDPGRYLQSLQQLLAWYWAAAPGAAGGAWAPLVVNTHGWVAGLGLELAAELLRAADPTHVVHLQTPNPRKNLPDGLFWVDGGAGGGPGGRDQQQQQQRLAAIIPLPAVRGGGSGAAGGEQGGGGSLLGGAAAASEDPGTASVVSRQSGAGGAGTGGRGLPAVEARSLHWLSWAQRVCTAHSREAAATVGAAAAGAGATAAAAAGDTRNGGGGGGGSAQSDAEGGADRRFADAAAGLAAAAPYATPLGALSLVLLHDAARPGQLPRVFNGAVVGLVAGAPGGAPPNPGPSDHHHHQQQPRPCLGIGLVRAVDARTGQLFLLTDTAPAVLSRVTELHAGRLELPQALLSWGGGATPYDALFSLAAAATGSGAHRARNNLLRASLAPQQPQRRG